MGLFGKNQEELGEIPSLPELPAPKDFSLPELPKSIPETIPEITKKEISELPSLPELKQITSTISPDIIKQEIINPQQNMQKSQYNPDQSLPPIQPIIQKATAPPIRAPIQTPIRSNATNKDIEPVYVRLDKFESSIQTFDEIRAKIDEIEKLLMKTKEIKQKEDQELEAWEREIKMVKARIDSVDKTIFNQLD